MTRPRISHRFEYLLLTTVTAVVTRLPERAADLLGVTLGWLAGSLLRIRRSVVLENLERAFPEKSSSWRKEVATRTYRHFGREAIALIRFQSMSTEEIRGRCAVDGLDLFRAPVAQGVGVIALTGHFGNWEIAALSITSRGVPVDAVARRQRNPLFDDYMVRVRGRLGVGVIYQHEATRAIMRSLREARVVALLADQNFAGKGVFVNFFKVPASTVRGPGLLAQRTGSPVVFADSQRLSGWRAEYRIRLFPIHIQPSGDAEQDIHRWTSAYVSKLEEVIRESPEQYFWFHKRWKTRPPGPEPRSSRQVASGTREALGEADRLEEME